MVSESPRPVCGIDPSLTGTGVAAWDGHHWKLALVASQGHKDDDLAQRYDRLETLTSRILAMVPEHALVAIETPAYGAYTGKHHDRSGLWWLLIDRVLASDHEAFEVPPTTLKKYVTGNGRAGKDEVIASMIRRYPELDIHNNNVADAAGLAVIARRISGQPMETDLSANRLASFNKIHAPVASDRRMSNA